MSAKIKKHIHFLSLLLTENDKQKQAILKTMNMEQLRVLVECIYNIQHGVIKISNTLKKKLSHHKCVIRKITEQGKTPTQRKKLLVKHHTLLSLFLKTILNQLKYGTRDDSDSETEV